MSYIGKEPADSFISFAKQDFSTSATTSYTLDNAVTNENELALFINFVRQEPTTAYTASGTTLTLTSATASTDDMYCVYLGQAKQTVNAPDGSVGNSQVASTIITGQTAETSIATDDTVLIHDTSAGALRKMTRANFVSGVGGDNTPAFSAYLSSAQSIPNTTETKIVFQTETFDTDSAYNTSTGVFTVPSGEGGKYFFSIALGKKNWNTSQAYIVLKVNDGSSDTDHLFYEDGDAQGDNNTLTQSGIVNMSAGHTAAVYYYQDGGANGTLRSSIGKTYFNGYKLIGV